MITIAVSELKTALPGFSKVINKRTTLPVLGCILFESKQGQLQLTATNLDDYVLRSIPGVEVEAFRAAIPMESLHKIIRGCPATSNLTIECVKEEVRVTYPLGGTVLTERINCPPVTDIPAVPTPPWQDSITVDSEFKEAVREALDSASTDESRFVLNSAFIDVSDPEAHYVVGTNGKEMFTANSFKLSLKESLILPSRKFLLWKGFLEDGNWSISLSSPIGKKESDPKWIKIQSNGWTLITRQIDGIYPNWRAPVPTHGERTVVRFSEEAQQFLTMAAPRLPGAGDLNAPVRLVSTEDGALILQVKEHVHEASIPVTGAIVEGNPIHRSMNRQYLLKAMKLGLTELEVFQDSEAVVVFRNAGKRLIVACLRDEATAPPPEPITIPETPDTDSVPRTVPQDQPEREPKETMKTANRIENVPTETATKGAPAPASAFDQVRLQLETIKEKLKGAVVDLNDSLKLLAQAQRERRATEKEIEEVRETLQSLQKIRI